MVRAAPDSGEPSSPTNTRGPLDVADRTDGGPPGPGDRYNPTTNPLGTFGPQNHRRCHVSRHLAGWRRADLGPLFARVQGR